MKTHRSRKFICIALGAFLGASGPAFGQNTRGARTEGSGAARSGASSTDSAADIEKVRVTRASNFLGMDVIASDGRKVGDIVDYYLNLGSAPHLEYVVVMTGGFLDMGGDRRAVPASAVTSTGDNCKIGISSAQFWDVPVLPENRQRFLADPQNRQRISQLFRGGSSTADTAGGSSGSSTASQSATTSSTSGTTASTATASTDDPNRPGAMTGRSGSQQGNFRLVSYNDLRNADAYGKNDQRLGYFADAWINLNDNRAPYIEITPTFQPFRSSFDRRYAVPTAKLTQKREFYGYDLNVTTDELNQAEPVSETEGVRMLEEGRFGNDVLRVTLPER